MTPEFIKLDNCSMSVQRVHIAPEGYENLIVIDDLCEDQVNKGVLLLRLSHLQAVELIKQLSVSILDTP